MRAPAYFRHQQQAANLLGQTGTIVSVTSLENGEVLAVVVLKDKQRFTLPVAQGSSSVPAIGQKIRLVWRRLRTTPEGLIAYGLKAQVVA